MLLLIKDKIILWMKHFTVTCVPKHNHIWQREAKLSIQQWQPNNKQQECNHMTAPIFPSSFPFPMGMVFLSCKVGSKHLHLALTAHVFVCGSNRVTQLGMAMWLCIDRHQRWAGKAGIGEDGRNWKTSVTQSIQISLCFFSSLSVFILCYCWQNTPF